ncbi:MAG: alpha/beta hydrolase [Chthoniobacter sp.]|uniref:alpha/beta hydrolase n=1 Tax=Chthoniobacter sp. TaxID=2510640 RepID=UPI0032A207DB
MTKSRLFPLLRLLVITYVLLCVIVGVFQRRIIYFPFYKTEAGMLAKAAELGCQPWRAPDGTIIGWTNGRHEPPAANRLVLFHGNAGYALMRTHYIDGFGKLDGGRLWEVYLFEYPGFGARSGKLGQESFIEAGSQAIDALKAADSRPIYLLGESLGSGLASALAQCRPKDVAGLFLLTPYARLGDVAVRRFGFLPVRQMLRDPWDNVTALHDYRGPMAMLIAGQDEVVTAAQGRLLYDSYAGPKRLWTDPGATHNTVNFSVYAPWWHEVSDFLLDDTRPHLSSP